MYTYNEIQRVNIEISSMCQAKCPMCARNYHGGMDNPELVEANLSLELFKKAMPPEFVARLTSFSMCGNFGDPILNNDVIEMVKYITQHSPDIYLDLHTNASARSVKWWKQLAEAMPARHMVHFGIDGLEDTHSIYRIGTDFNKIISNAKAYIAAGGKARWNFITFKHNEHQLEIARQMSKDLGFESFQEKQTSRFIGTNTFSVLKKDGTEDYKLEMPSEQKIIFIDRKTVDNYKQVMASATIHCQVEDEKSVYIDAQGYMWPCCFLGGVLYHYSTPERLVWNFLNDSKTSLEAALDKMGGKESLNLRQRSIQDIVDSPVWQSMWDQSFEDRSILMCSRVCGKFAEPIISQCRDQFLDLENF